MNDRASIPPLRRAALFATAITRLLTIGLLLLAQSHIILAHRRPMLLQTRERPASTPSPAPQPLACRVFDVANRARRHKRARSI